MRSTQRKTGKAVSPRNSKAPRNELPNGKTRYRHSPHAVAVWKFLSSLWADYYYGTAYSLQAWRHDIHTNYFRQWRRMKSNQKSIYCILQLEIVSVLLRCFDKCALTPPLNGLFYRQRLLIEGFDFQAHLEGLLFKITASSAIRRLCLWRRCRLPLCPSSWRSQTSQN